MSSDPVTMRIDPIRLEVVRNALNALADEMGVALQRAAYSTNIKTRLDFSCAVFNADRELIAQSFGQAAHLGSLVHFVPRIVEAYDDRALEPGDALLANGGRHGGVHLNDICLVAPVFVEDEIVAYVAALAHHLDVGGAQPGSISGRSRSLFEEGLTIPPVRIMRAGRIERDVFEIIVNNIRATRETGGDLRAQLAAVNVGSQRLGELVGRYSWPVLDEIIRELLDYAERVAREEVRAMPNGTYAAEGFMDSDGIDDEPVKVAVSVTIEDDEISFDLAGSDEQRPCAINATYAMQLSMCAYVTRALMRDDVPLNAGFYRVLRVDAPAGSIVNSHGTVAIGGGWETAFRVMETAFQALSRALPERMAAGSKGCLCNIAFGGPSRRPDEDFVFYEAMGGGYGARATKDGIDAVQPHVQNTENAPIEETEVNYPVRIERYELIEDSEGAGRFRGGLGLRRDYRFEGPVTFSVLADKAKFAPWGMAGGGDARPAHYVLDPDGEAVECGSKTTIELPAGAVFSVQMGGGGGFGDPLLRDPDDVLRDVLDGKVTRARAREGYGVVIADGAASVDDAATDERRAQLRARQADSRGD